MNDLTNEQLCALAQAGDEQAVSLLIKANLPFVRKIANQIVGNPVRQEHLSACGVGFDDLVQAGSIGLWKAINSYDLSSGNKFLTYAAPAIKRAMIDLIRQYSQGEDASGEVVSLNDVHNDAIRNLLMLPNKTQPEQIYIEQETMEELHEAMDALPDRENVYVQYRFGFENGEDHPLTETAQYFHLTESRAKSVERSALKLLRQELLFEVPERAYAKAEDNLTRKLVAADELHAVELRLKSQRKRGRKITVAVYKYLADCGGKWGALSYNFKDDTTEILLLAEWDTILSHRFAMRAVEHFRIHHNDKLPDKIVLTFIGPEQRSRRYDNKFEAGN